MGRGRGLKGDNGRDIFSRKVSDDEGSAVKCPNFASGDQIRPIDHHTNLGCKLCGVDLHPIINPAKPTGRHTL